MKYTKNEISFEESSHEKTVERWQLKEKMPLSIFSLKHLSFDDVAFRIVFDCHKIYKTYDRKSYKLLGKFQER